MVDVTFSVANGAELRHDLALLVQNETGIVIGRLTPTSTVCCQLPRSRPVFKFGVRFATQRFMLSSGCSTAEMLWDGTHWDCKTATEVKVQHAVAGTQESSVERFRSLFYIGLAGVAIGAIWAVLAFNMDVTRSSFSFAEGYRNVVNLDLVQRRNLHFMGAGLVILCSLLTTLFAVSQHRTSSRAQ